MLRRAATRKIEKLLRRAYEDAEAQRARYGRFLIEDPEGVYTDQASGEQFTEDDLPPKGLILKRNVDVEDE